MDFSIVVPCYNEGPSLTSLVQRFSDIKVPYTWELLLVNNGSGDETKSVLDSLAKSQHYPFLRPVTLESNRGYGGGILAGLEQARGTTLAWTHADLQTPPEDLFRAYELLHASGNPGKTLVKGLRQNRHPAAMALTLGMQVAASACLGQPLKDINAQPKVFPKELFAHFQNPPADFNLDLYLYHLALSRGYRVLTLPVIFERRPHGTSKWAFSLRSRARHILATLRYIRHLAQQKRRDAK